MPVTLSGDLGRARTPAVKQEETPPQEQNAQEGDDAGDGGGATFEIEDRRRLKHMAYVTSGCGKNKDKERVVATFWDVVWRRLEKMGWKKVDGTGNSAGCMFFYPKGVAEGTGTKGRDYYDRIKDVLDRLRDKRNLSEGGVIEDFDAEVYRREEEETKASRKRKSSSAASSSAADSEGGSGGVTGKKSAKLDSWKEGRKFTKKTSRVGSNYQPSSIPEVGENPAVEEEPMLLWSPSAAEEAETSMETVEGLLKDVPPNKKFQSLCKLAENGYNVDGFEDMVKSLPLTNGADWDEAKRKQFSEEIFKNRKNLALVCKNMGIAMETCLIYYYSAFKKSTDYRLMKTIYDDERYEKTARFETVFDVCAICDDGGELVICDECEGEYHLKCMRPPLKSVPEGRWECDECVDRKVLQLRNHLLYQSNLSKQAEEKEGEPVTKEVVPNDATLEAVRSFAKKVSTLLASNEIEGEVEVKVEEVGEEQEV